MVLQPQGLQEYHVVLFRNYMESLAQQNPQSKPKQSPIMRLITKISGRRGSNSRHSAWEADHLPRTKQIEFQINGFIDRKKFNDLAHALFGEHKSNTGHLNQKSLKKNFHSVAGVSASCDTQNLMQEKRVNEVCRDRVEIHGLGLNF